MRAKRVAVVPHERYQLKLLIGRAVVLGPRAHAGAEASARIESGRRGGQEKEDCQRMGAF